MLATPYSAIAVMVICSSVMANQRLDAQATPASGERGCLGHEMTFALDAFSSMADFPVIAVVPAGTPAALAGLQAGDSVVRLSGRDSREMPTGQPRLFAPGDTMTLTVRRQKADFRIVLVFGRTLEEGSGGVTTRVCRPVTAPPKPAEHRLR